MNRERFIERNFELEGSDRSILLGQALGQICDPDFIEALLHHIAALDQFGGQLYIAAGPRTKLNNKGQAVDAAEAGSYETLGYVFHYGSKPTIRRLQTEEESGEAPAAPEVEEPAEAEVEPVNLAEDEPEPEVVEQT
jgi:hypothetical protein